MNRRVLNIASALYLVVFLAAFVATLAGTS